MRLWPPGRGVVTGLFVLLYATLRFAVDVFRDYEAAWLGLGTGQVFNLVMAAIGLFLLVFFLRRPVRERARIWKSEQGVGFIRAGVLMFLILYPLGIPTSWTQVNIQEKRMEDAGK